MVNRILDEIDIGDMFLFFLVFLLIPITHWIGATDLAKTVCAAYPAAVFAYVKRKDIPKKKEGEI